MEEWRKDLLNELCRMEEWRNDLLANILLRCGCWIMEWRNDRSLLWSLMLFGASILFDPGTHLPFANKTWQVCMPDWYWQSRLLQTLTSTCRITSAGIWEVTVAVVLLIAMPWSRKFRSYQQHRRQMTSEFSLPSLYHPWLLGWGKLIVCAASGRAALDSLTQLHWALMH